MHSKTVQGVKDLGHMHQQMNQNIHSQERLASFWHVKRTDRSLRPEYQLAWLLLDSQAIFLFFHLKPYYGSHEDLLSLLQSKLECDLRLTHEQFVSGKVALGQVYCGTYISASQYYYCNGPQAFMFLSLTL